MRPIITNNMYQNHKKAIDMLKAGKSYRTISTECKMSNRDIKVLRDDLIKNGFIIKKPKKVMVVKKEITNNATDIPSVKFNSDFFPQIVKSKRSLELNLIKSLYSLLIGSTTNKTKREMMCKILIFWEVRGV